MTTPRVTVPVEDLERVRDLLMERIHGSPARSPAHNARLEVEAMLSAAPAPEGGAEVPSSWSIRYQGIATREEAPAEVGEQWLWRVPGRGWVLCDREDDVVREVRVEGEYVETEVVALSALRAQPTARSGEGQ